MNTFQTLIWNVKRNDFTFIFFFTTPRHQPHCPHTYTNQSLLLPHHSTILTHHTPLPSQPGRVLTHHTPPPPQPGCIHITQIPAIFHTSRKLALKTHWRHPFIELSWPISFYFFFFLFKKKQKGSSQHGRVSIVNLTCLLHCLHCTHRPHIPLLLIATDAETTYHIPFVLLPAEILLTQLVSRWSVYTLIKFKGRTGKF